MVELGPIELLMAKQAAQANRPLDGKIANPPELQIGLGLYLQAFFDLDSERSHSMAVTRIPGSVIRLYAREFDFDDDQTDLLDYYISQMDDAHCKRLREKSKSEISK